MKVAAQFDCPKLKLLSTQPLRQVLSEFECLNGAEPVEWLGRASMSDPKKHSVMPLEPRHQLLVAQLLVVQSLPPKIDPLAFADRFPLRHPQNSAGHRRRGRVVAVRLSQAGQRVSVQNRTRHRQLGAIWIRRIVETRSRVRSDLESRLN